MNERELNVAQEAQAWVQACPPPRERPANLRWDVFLSYRSIDRAWTLALRDVLRQRGYEVFLDQYVLEAGTVLEERLRRELALSASGVLIWSKPAQESDWVRKEFEAMDTLRRDPNRPLPFSLIVAKLDATKLPDIVHGAKFVDFSDYPAGPRGKEVLTLLFGLRGEALSEQAVERVRTHDSLVTAELKKIASWSSRELSERIVERAQELDIHTWLSTPQVPCAAGSALIDVGRPDAAIGVLKNAVEHFPVSLRPRQLLALAHRRVGAMALDAGRMEDARNATNACIEICNGLRAEDQNDPETLGIHAAALTQRWEIDGGRASLLQAQAFYKVAFERSPHDYYTGINAAAKAAILEDRAQARTLARRVLLLVEKAPIDDYYASVTGAEAKLLCDEIAAAARGYRDAVSFHAEAVGDIKSTLAQLIRLIPALKISQPDAETLLRPFADVLDVRLLTLMERCFQPSTKS